MDKQIFYGVWLLSIGWLRGEGGRALMFEHKQIAEETARRVKNAKVYFIDQSLVDIEQKLLDAEKSDFFSPWFLFDLRRLGKMLKGK